MDEILGVVKLFAISFVPQGWLPCDGRTLPIAQNQPLFALLTTTFGGDGQTNFAVPNLQNAAPAAGLHYLICVQGVFPNRA